MTSKMLVLCVLYTAAAGAANSPSSASAPDWACTSATNFCWSPLGKAAASTTAVRDLIIISTLPVSTCSNAAGFLAISRSKMVKARDKTSIESTSSASLALNVLSSFPRTAVASFRSVSSWEIDEANPSIFELTASMLAVILPMVASRSSFDASPVSMSKPRSVLFSLHHAAYSVAAFVAAAASFSSLPARSSMREIAAPSGFSAFAAIGTARQVKSATILTFIVWGGAASKQIL
mmetsp:Transcript_73004/g.126617  ORF Transcript_73004/g.126617 Transcript_73004/m.126617 type:complete len:235 (+) Transcript_73004:1498-2202(+)